jgi:hypothetical protein
MWGGNDDRSSDINNILQNHKKLDQKVIFMGVNLQAVPSPSWPLELFPQAQRVPSVFNAMV